MDKHSWVVVCNTKGEISYYNGRDLTASIKEGYKFDTQTAAQSKAERLQSVMPFFQFSIQLA